MRKASILFAAVVFAALIVSPAVAHANFAIHGSYVDDTDACAGCHRAHTSFASVGWVDTTGAEHESALLISGATEMYEFCYACHDDAGQGADTNVQSGIYEGTLYGSEDTTLNGGAFETLGGMPVTSNHAMTGAWGAYGGGLFADGTTNARGDVDQLLAGDIFALGTGNAIQMNCASCHDPHGSANYRILQSYVNGNYVGGYEADGETPDPWVVSNETNYPVTGWLKHEAGAAQAALYVPNYTTPLYAKAPGAAATEGMSGWCSGCHSAYILKKSDYDAGDFEDADGDGSADTPVGFRTRHRHPMNVPMTNYKGTAPLEIDRLPLAHDTAANDPGEPALPTGSVVNEDSDWIECLTCHYAHGTNAQMEGYAADPEAYSIQSFPNLASGNGASMLLRMDNRGVCEVCHNK